MSRKATILIDIDAEVLSRSRHEKKYATDAELKEAAVFEFGWLQQSGINILDIKLMENQ